ncbi:hypothetical protein [Roseiarcus sp.]|uniref:hypothetical protein n=1 Tax=Roseiarcus sp. TaxID=1969460 RepID=UPI003F9D1D79
MAEEPESLILRILCEMRAEMATKADLEALRSEMATSLSQMATKSELKSEIHSLRADVASDLLTMRKELSEQIVGLRRAVVDYHTSGVGHGVLISDLDARLRRVEQHRNLPPMTAG